MTRACLLFLCVGGVADLFLGSSVHSINQVIKNSAHSANKEGYIVHLVQIRMLNSTNSADNHG